METQEQYFGRIGAPAANSPVGKVMVRLLAKNAGMDFETARAQAKQLLLVAAKRKGYTTPAVYSAEQLVARRNAAASYWAQKTAGQAAATA